MATDTPSQQTVEPTWSPPHLRKPSASGARGDVKFAFFAEKRRLLVQRDGEMMLYDCGDHQISAIRALAGNSEALMFTSQRGELGITELRELS